jgi:hypothetical protein
MPMRGGVHPIALGKSASDKVSGHLTVTLTTIRCLKQLFYGFKNLHEYRYDVRTLTNRGLRNRVISVRTSRSKDPILDWKIIY